MNKITGYTAKSFWVNNQMEIFANEEQQEILNQLNHMTANSPADEDVHYLWHSTPQYDGEGCFDYGQKLRAWAKDKPEVKVFSFDDHCFMSSLGFIIPSSSKYEHMGLNVILLPQAGKPVDLFLYPHHADALLNALTEAVQEARALPSRDFKKPSNVKMDQLQQMLLDSVKES